MMEFTIRWKDRLNSVERRRPRHWLRRFAHVAEWRPGSIVVRGGELESAPVSATLTLAVIGRPRLAYALDEWPARQETRVAA